MLDLRELKIEGDVLDVVSGNYGSIFNLIKRGPEYDELDYIDGKRNEKDIKENHYDNCVLFFTINSLFKRREKNDLFKGISQYLKDDGVLYIWDFDKGYNKMFNCKINVLLPEDITKEIVIKDNNLFKNNSKKSNLQMFNKYFTIEDMWDKDGLYYIKGKKRKV